MSVTAFRRLSENVIAVANSAIGDANLAGLTAGYSPFRFGREEVLLIATSTAHLTTKDICAINSSFDNSECAKNRLVKTDIAGALSLYYNSQSIHVYEIGSGKFPIIPYFPEEMAISYHAIEIDRHSLDLLKEKGISASGWGVIKNPPHPSDRPSIVVSVYALHFMADAALPTRIERLTTLDGFFVGNYYANSKDRKNVADREALKTILQKKGMSYLVLPDPSCGSNEYWLISKAGDVSPMHEFANTLQATITRNRALKPQAVPS